MKKVLFVVIAEKGHINPSIGVAQHLQRMGFDISFYATHDISEQLAIAGFTQFLGSRSTSQANQGAEFASRIRDRDWLRNWIKDLLINQTPAGIAPMREIVRDFDLVVCDPMIYPAVIACEQEKKTWIALSNSLNPVLPENMESELLSTVAWLSEDRQRLFDGMDVRFRGCDALSRHLTIAFTTPEFSGGPVEGVEQVGPAKTLGPRGDETEFPWEKLRKDAPLAFASFGSQVYHQPAYFKKLIDAVEGRAVQLVAAVHDLPLRNVPENVILTGYAPQLELLKQAKVLITHGGANSVMEALAANVPILINPICNDQFHQAWFLERSNGGRLIDLETMSIEEIWDSIHWALNADISAIARSYEVDGSEKAAELIAGL